MQIVSNASLQIYGGDIYVGVMTVVNSIKQVLMMPLQGFAQGAQPSSALITARKSTAASPRAASP